ARHTAFAPVKRGVEIRDGGAARAGGTLAVTAHFTPGHTPGVTTWTWTSCAANDCRHIVYADSLNAVSAPGFRFRDHPDVVADLLRSMDKVAGLECDILLAPHPEQSDRAFKPGECRRYAQAARHRLETRLTEERR